MNHVVFIPSLSNSLSSRGVPTSPANIPLEISSGESSPPYDPSQPATASKSTPKAHSICFPAIIPYPMIQFNRLRLRRHRLAMTEEWYVGVGGLSTGAGLHLCR